MIGSSQYTYSAVLFVCGFLSHVLIDDLLTAEQIESPLQTGNMRSIDKDKQMLNNTPRILDTTNSITIVMMSFQMLLNIQQKRCYCKRTWQSCSA